MTRVVYLHVGAPRTGTAYLQDRLRINQARLAENGVHYPLGIHASQFRPALDLLDRAWEGTSRSEVAGDWDSLMGKVRRLDGTVVISSEILASANPERIRQAMADLDHSEVHVVYSARDLGRQLPAEWQEGIKHRQRRPFARFLRDAQAARRRQSRMWFWRVQGLPDVLTRWSSGLPPEHVHLVTAPRADAPSGLLWQRFCEVLGIEEGWAPLDSAQGNRSIGVAETALLRRLNSRLPKDEVGPVAYRELVRRMLVHETLAQREGMTTATLPPELYPWAGEVAEEWIEWVEGSGIHVVGDVDELRPVPPVEGAAWVDPDKARAPQVLDVALDALAAMTTEAAARRGQDAQLTRKIGRAARRLRGG